jgi:hypothetical protein
VQAVVTRRVLAYGRGMVRVVVAAGLALAAFKLPPPRATVSITPLDEAGPPRNAVLVLPTTCIAAADYLCEPSVYVRDADGQSRFRVAASFPEVIDPLVRLKLELAGFTLADAGTLQLETAERIDRFETRAAGDWTSASAGTTVGEAPTLLSLPHDELVAAAHSIGLQAVLSSTLRITSARYGQKIFEVMLELRSIPEHAMLWTVRCAEPLEGVEHTARLLANCVGDGVLAAKAPDALIRRPR